MRTEPECECLAVCAGDCAGDCAALTRMLGLDNVGPKRTGEVAGGPAARAWKEPPPPGGIAPTSGGADRCGCQKPHAIAANWGRRTRTSACANYT